MSIQKVTVTIDFMIRQQISLRNLLSQPIAGEYKWKIIFQFISPAEQFVFILFIEGIIKYFWYHFANWLIKYKSMYFLFSYEIPNVVLKWCNSSLYGCNTREIHFWCHTLIWNYTYYDLNLFIILNMLALSSYTWLKLINDQYLHYWTPYKCPYKSWSNIFLVYFIS